MVARANLLPIERNAGKMTNLETGAIGFGTAVGAFLLVVGVLVLVRRRNGGYEAINNGVSLGRNL